MPPKVNHPKETLDLHFYLHPALLAGRWREHRLALQADVKEPWGVQTANCVLNFLLMKKITTTPALQGSDQGVGCAMRLIVWARPWLKGGAHHLNPTSSWPPWGCMCMSLVLCSLTTWGIIHNETSYHSPKPNQTTMVEHKVPAARKLHSAQFDELYEVL